MIRTNYAHYGLLDQYIDVMVADATQSPLRCCEIFDAIITDRKLIKITDSHFHDQLEILVFSKCNDFDIENNCTTFR